MRERVSQTAVPLGSAEISMGVIQESSRLRIALQSNNGNAGFITISSWTPDPDKRIPRSPAKKSEPHTMGHRRSQSLPPKLGVKLFVPPQCKLSLIFKNPSVCFFTDKMCRGLPLFHFFFYIYMYFFCRFIHTGYIRVLVAISAFTN